MKMRKRRKLTRAVDWWEIWLQRIDRASKDGKLAVTFQAPQLTMNSPRLHGVIAMGIA